MIGIVCLCWGTKLGLQVTNSVLFLAAYEGLQNCMLHWSQVTAGQVVNLSLALAFRKQTATSLCVML